MKDIKKWKLIYNSLSDNMPVMLLYVLESKGSSPGRQGFFMVVNANIRVVNPLMEDSIDTFIFQKLEEKTSRINEIWYRAGKTNALNLEDEYDLQIIQDYEAEKAAGTLETIPYEEVRKSLGL